MNYDYDIFCDCGAPSLYNKLSRIRKGKGTTGASFAERKADDYSYTETEDYAKYRKDYIAFLHEHQDKITTYSNLDVINNPRLTFENQRILESEGLHPIPVYHLSANDKELKWLKKYLDQYEHIALGGIFPNPIPLLIPMLDRLFKDYFLDSQGFPRVKVHGFGCTAMQLMTRYPWYSVDSASARKLAMYGWLVLPKLSGNELTNVRISNRDVPLTTSREAPARAGKAQPFFDTVTLAPRFTDGYLREFMERAQMLGSELETLSSDITERTAWNYMVYRYMLNKLVPKWPWNIKTREPQEGASQDFIMYFAGILSKDEERKFWDTVAQHPELNGGKGRLQSFFYKEKLKMIMQLKSQEHNEDKEK